MKTYTLLGVRGPYQSQERGLLGGHSGQKIYGRLDCPSALRAIARGGYAQHRVFFANEEIASACGYRPCGTCMPIEYKNWRLTNQKNTVGLMYRSWVDISLAERVQLRQQLIDGKEIVAIAEEAGLDPTKIETLKRRLREVREVPPEKLPVIATGKFEEHWALLCDLIGRDDSRASIPGKRLVRETNRRKVIVVCDLHGHPDMALIAQIIREKPDIVVLAGDVFDAFAFSHWEKDHSSPLADELARVRAALEAFVAHGIQVKMISGNHDDRAKKYFARNISAEFMPLVQYDLLELVACDPQGEHAISLSDSKHVIRLALLPGIEVIDNHYDFTTPMGAVHPGAIQNNWLVHLGDALIGHAETARKGEVRSVDAFAEWVDLWRTPLGWGDSRLILQGHVHRAVKSFPHAGHQVRIEGGFAGRVSDLQYSHDYGATKYPPPVISYTHFEQSLVDGQWRTDLGSVDIVLC